MTRVIVTSPVWSLNGVNVFSANLVRGLRAAGMEARILLTGVTYRERKPMPVPPDIPVEQLGIPAFATWSARRYALKTLLEREAPCIYLPNHDFRHSSISPALSPAVGIVGIIHSDDPQHYQHAADRSRSWNATVAVSDRIAERLRESEVVDEGRLATLPYGVVAAAVLPERSGSGEISLIYTGRLDLAQKRIGDLTAIASALVHRNVLFSLTIVGDGDARGWLEKDIVRRGLGSRVRIVAPVGNDRVLELCARSDAFVLPSAFEGMPISLLEAMGQGCVPFVTEIESGVPELIRDGYNGFTVRVGDIESFADRIEAFARSAEMRSRMPSEAWRTIEAGRFRMSDMISRYMELFDRVASEMRRGDFSRTGDGRIPAHVLPLRERIAAPLWSLRPVMRKQHDARRWTRQR